MSKSRGNVVSPASIVERLGADTARCYILFIGPPDQDADWSDEGVEGVHRFLGRLWRLAAETAERAGPAGAAIGSDAAARGRRSRAPAQDPLGDREGERRPAPVRVQHGDRRGDGAAERMLAAARLAPRSGPCASRSRTAASLLFPFAPHVCADIYDRLTGERVWESPWPQADPELLESEVYELVCQVNGKVRDRVQAAAGRERGGAQGAVPAGAQRAGPTSTAGRSSRRSSCPASS